MKFLKFALILLFIIGVILITACTRPYSKESYLEEYKEFIQKVEKNYSDYSEKDWIKSDNKYKIFNEKWYKIFSNDLTWKEEILITRYSFNYKFI